MYTIFDCLTKERVSDRSYATTDEANHDYYMNQGHTYIGVIETDLSLAQPMQDAVSPTPAPGLPEGSGLAAQHSEGPYASVPLSLEAISDSYAAAQKIVMAARGKVVNVDCLHKKLCSITRYLDAQSALEFAATLQDEQVSA